MGNENDTSSTDGLSDLLKTVDKIKTEAEKTSLHNIELEKLLKDCKENLKHLNDKMLAIQTKSDKDVRRTQEELGDVLASLQKDKGKKGGDPPAEEESTTDGEVKKGVDPSTEDESTTDGEVKNGVDPPTKDESTKEITAAGVFDNITNIFQSSDTSEKTNKAEEPSTMKGGSSRRRKKNKYTRRKKKNKGKRRYTRGKK